MRTVTFRVPLKHLELRQGYVIFRHPWKGVEDMAWIVPDRYLVTAHMSRNNDKWVIQINQQFFERGTNDQPDTFMPLYVP